MNDGPKEREIFLFISAIRMEVAQAEIDEEYLLAFNISAQNCNYTRIPVCNGNTLSLIHI